MAMLWDVGPLQVSPVWVCLLKGQLQGAVRMLNMHARLTSTIRPFFRVSSVSLWHIMKTCEAQGICRQEQILGIWGRARAILAVVGVL